LVGEVDVAGGVDQVQVVYLAILSLVVQSSGLGLNRNATLFLDVHRIQNLGRHLAVGQATTALDQAVSQGRFAMIDVGNNREMADVIHKPVKKQRKCWGAMPERRHKKGAPMTPLFSPRAENARPVLSDGR